MHTKLMHRATGIGSLPHQSVDEGINLIKENLQYIPHWPQLPRRNPREGIVRQYLAPLVQAGLVTSEEEDDGKPYFRTDAPDWDERVLNYYETLVEVEENNFTESNVGEMFAFPADTAEGFYAFLQENWEASEVEVIKGQVSGPLVIGLQVTDPAGSAAFYNDQLREILVKTLTYQSCWQLQKLAAFQKPVLIFIDDPAIYGYGTSTYVGLSREFIQQSVQEMVTGIKNAGGVSGVHCCAGVDWSLLFDLPLDVVNFDAYGYFSSMLVYTDQLKDFLQRGGILSWGIVPTSQEIEEENAESLMAKLREGIDTLVSHGVERRLLEEQLMVTPSCGAGTLTEAQAEKVYRLLREVEQNL